MNVLALLLCSKGQRLLLHAESEKESKKNRAILLIEGLAAACEVSMADLHQARTPNPNAGIDAVGWLFSALVAVIVAAAVMVAYKANDTMVANAPVSHVVAR